VTYPGKNALSISSCLFNDTVSSLDCVGLYLMIALLRNDEFKLTWKEAVVF
jgi:hypothetical protein